MSRLARSVPGFSSLGALEPGTISPNIILNRGQLPPEAAKEAVLGAYSVTSAKLADGAVTGRVVADAALLSRHFPLVLALQTYLYGLFGARSGSRRADGSFTFFAAATSGGAVTQRHDVTFEDGIITAWTQT